MDDRTLDLFKKNFAKDLSNMQATIAWALEQERTGSFAARHPSLGKMFRCPYCRTRRRQGTAACCTPTYAKTQRAWDAEQGFYQAECDERVIANFFPKSFLKRIVHKRHGQNRFFKVRQLAKRFIEDPKLLESAVAELQERWPLVKTPEPHAIPAFAERYFRWQQTRIVKAQKIRARESRKINRGA
jgi:hypothetical protein